MSGTKETIFVSAVVYVRNNHRTLGTFLEHVYGNLERLFSDFELICVNDASSDGSEELIRSFAEEKKHSVTLVNMGFMQGVELSMNAGEDISIGDFVYEFDSAAVFWPEDMMEHLYRKMQEGYDIISACPEGKGRASSRLFYHLFNKYSTFSVRIRTEAFRLTSRRAINRVSAQTHMRLYKKAVNAYSGLRQTFLSFVPQQTEIVDQKNEKERRKLAADALILFTDIGYKIAFCVAVVMLIFAAVVGVSTVVIYATGNPVEGWTPIMLFLAVGFFVLFLILAIVIKYLSLILNLNFNRQKYVVQEIEKL